MQHCFSFFLLGKDWNKELIHLMFVSCLDMIEHKFWYSQTNFPAFYHIGWKSLIQTASDFNLKSEKKPNNQPRV